jgi:hypothetical protein
VPRRRAVRSVSGFAELQKQTEQLVVNLRKEIHSKEAELNQLRDEERKLSGLIGLRETAVGEKVTVSGGGRARMNWGAVLEQMPKEFKAGDVQKLRGLRDKRHSEIFAAITRWIEAGSVERKERGVYERVQSQTVKKTG